MSTATRRPGHPWWRGAVIYQIYPRSFQDTNADGVGDLPGIVRHLDYLVDLGVDAVWISPFFKSPMRDFGYDVADYRAVDPLFGTLEDFDTLLLRAHDLGLKVLIDFVPSHTSDEHRWFLESRASRDNPRANWYVWSDPRADGMPPNNWISAFGGVAWTWEARRAQYFLHNFLPSQPDLNFHEPAVIEALLDEAKFWLERGVDGFRLDAIDYGVHDPGLADNPTRPPERRPTFSMHGNQPFEMQIQSSNHARPELSALFLKPLHALASRYGARVLLGELSGEDAIERAAAYTDGGGLDLAYTFDLLRCAPHASTLREVVQRFESAAGPSSFACWSLSNHDVERAVTRFGAQAPADALRALLPVMVCSLRGSPCLYQGEELGLPEARLARSELRDPVGIAFYPQYAGRDGARTPMPWSHDRPDCGFSTAPPWLPIVEAHAERAVDLQRGHAASTFETVRRFLHWRRTQAALIHGAIEFIDGPQQLLIFKRTTDTSCLVCLFNLSDRTINFTPPTTARALYPNPECDLASSAIVLPPFEFWFGTLKR